MDKLEDELGRPTLYQARSIIAAAILLVAATCTPQTGVFYNAIPRHRCLVPAVDRMALSSNSTREKMIRIHIPNDDSCHQYEFANQSACVNTTCFKNATNSDIIPCKSGYFYDQTYFEKTVVSEWDLVCSQQMWNSFTKSLYFAGALFGAPPSGYLVDWFGRKRMSIILCLGLLTSGVGCSFAPTFPVYCMFRFLEGATSLSLMIAIFSYANEMAGRKYRAVVGTLLLSITSVTHTIQPLAAYFIRNWRHLNLFFALLTVPYLLMCPFVPESPRWLLTNGKTQEGKKVLVRFFKSKGKTMSEDYWNSLLATEANISEPHGSTSNFSDIFQRPYARVVIIITMYLWFSITGVFYGLVLNVGTLAGDPYLNAALNGFTEILGHTTYGLFVFKFGSLFCMRIGLFCSGTLCFVAMAAKQFSQYSLVALQVVRWTSITGKLFITVSFSAIYQYTPDVNPTTSRGRATGLTTCFGRIGSVVIPFLLQFQVGGNPVADIVFGILGTTGACLCLLLPNTSNKVFLSTLDDAEEYYRENMKRISSCIGSKTTANKEQKETESGKKLINNNVEV